MTSLAMTLIVMIVGVRASRSLTVRWENHNIFVLLQNYTNSSTLQATSKKLEYLLIIWSGSNKKKGD